MRPLTYCASANGQEGLDHSSTTGWPLKSASVRMRFVESMTSKAGAARPTAACELPGAAARAMTGKMMADVILPLHFRTRPIRNVAPVVQIERGVTAQLVAA